MKREKRMYTQKEREQYLEEFKNSSLSVGKYCEERAIPESTFRGWMKKGKANKFGEVSIESTDTNLAGENVTIIIDKIKIELQQGYNKNLLKSFMEVLIK